MVAVKWTRTRNYPTPPSCKSFSCHVYKTLVRHGCPPTKIIIMTNTSPLYQNLKFKIFSKPTFYYLPFDSYFQICVHFYFVKNMIWLTKIGRVKNTYSSGILIIYDFIRFSIWIYRIFQPIMRNDDFTCRLKNIHGR